MELTSFNAVTKNSMRDVRVLKTREGSSLPRGNRNSSYLGSARPTPDETQRFGDTIPFTGVVAPYFGGPAVEAKVWDGKISRARKIDTPSKKRTTRTAPPAGRRGVPGSRFR